MPIKSPNQTKKQATPVKSPNLKLKNRPRLQNSPNNSDHDSAFVKIVEFAPLLAFLLSFYFYDVFVATAVLMIGEVLATAILYLKLKSVPRLQLILLVVVLLFGGMTLYFDDPRFIKMKPTITLGLIGIAALISVYIDKPLLKIFIPTQSLASFQGKFSHALICALTWRFGLFYLFLSALNEFVWRTQSTEFWVNFRFFGITGLSMLFAITHVVWLMRKLKQPQSASQESSQMPLRVANNKAFSKYLNISRATDKPDTPDKE